MSGRQEKEEKEDEKEIFLKFFFPTILYFEVWATKQVQTRCNCFNQKYDGKREVALTDGNWSLKEMSIGGHNFAFFRAPRNFNLIETQLPFKVEPIAVHISWW